MIGNLLALAVTLVPVLATKRRMHGTPQRWPGWLAWAVCGALTSLAAAVANDLSPFVSDLVLYAFVLPIPILFTATITAAVMTGWPRVRGALGLGLAGYVLGLVVRAVIPPCCWQLDVAAPAVYAATGAVLACSW